MDTAAAFPACSEEITVFDGGVAIGQRMRDGALSVIRYADMKPLIEFEVGDADRRGLVATVLENEGHHAAAEFLKGIL